MTVAELKDELSKMRIILLRVICFFLLFIGLFALFYSYSLKTRFDTSLKSINENFILSLNFPGLLLFTFILDVLLFLFLIALLWMFTRPKFTIITIILIIISIFVFKGLIFKKVDVPNEDYTASRKYRSNNIYPKFKEIKSFNKLLAQDIQKPIEKVSIPKNNAPGLFNEKMEKKLRLKARFLSKRNLLERE